MMTRIDMLRAIVRDCQAQRIRINGRKVYVDLFTASAVVQIYDALNEANRAKFVALPWPQMIAVTWKLAKGAA